MAVLSSLHFGILLIAHAVLGIPWSAKPAARYEGYDLERGPVLYEAYYPEEENAQKELPSVYQEKRYFDRISVPEKSYQIPGDPYEIPYEPEMTEVREEYIRPNSGYISAFTATRPQTVQKKDYIPRGQRNGEYIFANQPSNEQSNRINLEYGNANDYSFPRSQSGTYGDPSPEESGFVEQREMNYGEDVQRIVPIKDEFIFGEPPMNKALEFEKPFGNLNQRIISSQNFGDNYNTRKETPRLTMENIFEPRPQTISYIFSTPKKADNLRSVELESESEDNDWPRNYGDNLLQAEIKKADEQELKKQEAKITSIEVSQVPRHKIRHHHGERPKRKYP